MSRSQVVPWSLDSGAQYPEALCRNSHMCVPPSQTTPYVTGASSSAPVTCSCSSFLGCLRSYCPCLTSRSGSWGGWAGLGEGELRGPGRHRHRSPAVCPDPQEHPQSPQDGHPIPDPLRAGGLPVPLLTAWRSHRTPQLLPQPLQVRSDPGAGRVREGTSADSPILSPTQEHPPGAPGAGHAHPAAVG